jgi:hypothetical protein
MTINCIYHVLGFLVERTDFDDMYDLLFNQECPTLSRYGMTVKIQGYQFSIVEFSHDDCLCAYYVIGTVFAETAVGKYTLPGNVRHRSIESWNLERKQDYENKRKQTQVLAFYLARHNLPFDIVSKIYNMAMYEDDKFWPLHNHPIWSKLIQSRKPEFYSIQDDCHCCS